MVWLSGAKLALQSSGDLSVQPDAGASGLRPKRQSPQNGETRRQSLGACLIGDECSLDPPTSRHAADCARRVRPRKGVSDPGAALADPQVTPSVPRTARSVAG